MSRGIECWGCLPADIGCDNFIGTINFIERSIGSELISRGWGRSMKYSKEVFAVIACDFAGVRRVLRA